MLMPFTLTVHTTDAGPTPAERAEAVEYARDFAHLGIDEYIAELIDDDTPFDAVVAHLLTFDPAWLLARPWCAGWTVDSEA